MENPRFMSQTLKGPATPKNAVNQKSLYGMFCKCYPRIVNAKMTIVSEVTILRLLENNVL